MHFADKPFPVALAIGFDDARTAMLNDIFARSGWALVQPTNAPDAQLILISDAHFRDEAFALSGIRAEAIRIAVGASVDSPADDHLPADASSNAIGDLLTLWRPPDCAALERMRAAFGRAALAPVVAGLQGELAAAVTLIDAGGLPDGHRLAGLAGTLGFVEASQAFNALHHGTGDATSARRHARTAGVAIDHWLKADD